MKQITESRAWLLQNAAANYVFDLDKGEFDYKELIPETPPGKFMFYFFLKEKGQKRKISFKIPFIFPGFMTAAFLVDGSLTGGKDRFSTYCVINNYEEYRLPKKNKTVAV